MFPDSCALIVCRLPVAVGHLQADQKRNRGLSTPLLHHSRALGRAMDSEQTRGGLLPSRRHTVHRPISDEDNSDASEEK
jgi:hypothetical protein